MHAPRSTTLAVVLCGLVVTAAQPLTSSAASVSRTSAEPRVTAATPQSELTAIKSLTWTSNVAISYGSGEWTFTSSGIPATIFTAKNYAVPANPFNVSAKNASIVATSSVLKNQHYNFTIPTTPQYSSTTTTNMGAIGVMVNGTVLYNPYEANKTTVATNDNFAVTKKGVTASFIDNCDGHPGPGGQYHYHGVPTCLVDYVATGKSTQVVSVTKFTGATTTAVAESNATEKKPVLIGFAFDGYGIYDNIDNNGKTIPVSSLDKCNGLFSAVPGYPNGIYHYVLENVKTDRSSLGCYHGVVSSAYTQALRGSIADMIGSHTVASSAAPATQTRVATARSLAANRVEDMILSSEFVAISRRAVC